MAAFSLAATPAWAESSRPVLTLGKANVRPFVDGISMSLSNDGKFVAAGTVEGEVIILDPRNQRTLRTFRAHDRHAQVLFLSDGTLVTSGGDGTILLWDPKNARLIRTISKGSGFKGHFAETQDRNGAASISSLAASQDGKRIAFTDYETIYIVEVGSGRRLASPVKPLSFADDRITRLAVSPDGRRAAWGSWAGDVAVWDIDRGTVVWSDRIPGQVPIDHSGHHPDFGGPDIVDTLSFSPDGELLAIGGKIGLLIAYDAQTGRRLHSESRAHVGSLELLAFLPGGRSLVAGYTYGLIRRVSVPEGEEEFSVENDVDGAIQLIASPDGKRIYSLQSGGFLGINDADSGSLLTEESSRMILSAAYSPDGKLLAAGGSSGVIRIYSIPGGKLLRTLKAGGKGVAGLVFSPDGGMLASMGQDNRLRVWISSSDAPLWEALVEPWLHGEAVFTPDGHRILAGGGRFLDAWDAWSGEKIRRVGSHPDNINGLAISPDGRYAATTCADARIYVWDIETGEKFFAPEKPDYFARAADVSFTPDGRQLVYRDQNGGNTLWFSVPDRRLLGKSPLPAGFTRKMFLSANGSEIHLLDERGTTTAKVFFFPIDPPRTIFRGLRAGGDVADISPDGRFLAIAGDDGVIRIWTVPQK